MKVIWTENHSKGNPPKITAYIIKIKLANIMIQVSSTNLKNRGVTCYKLELVI